MNIPTTKTCEKCGVYYETEREERHKLLCGARSRVTVYCGYCGNLVFDICYNPFSSMPEVVTFHGRPMCEDCQEKVAKVSIAVLTREN